MCKRRRRLSSQYIPSAEWHEPGARAEPAGAAAGARAARHAARAAAPRAPDRGARAHQQDERAQRRHDHRAHALPAQVTLLTALHKLR